MRDFHKFDVWRKAHELTLAVYRDSKTFPADERFGLTSQLRRSAASVAANIAEGCGRDTDADFKRLLVIAAGSASETQYHLLLARDLGYLEPDQHQPLDDTASQVKRMLTSLIRRLDKEPPG